MAVNSGIATFNKLQKEVIGKLSPLKKIEVLTAPRGWLLATLL